MTTVMAWGLATASALAQSPAQTQPPLEEARLRARYQLRVMEGVLERAVQHAAQMMNRRVQAVAPDMVLLTGSARVRGFRLENHGVFFDVDIPALRQSVSWTFRSMNQNNQRTEQALRSIKRYVETVSDKTSKGELERAVKFLEMRALPMQVASSPPGGNSAQVSATSAPQTTTVPTNEPEADATSPELPDWIQDPNEAYTTEVIAALIDAMLDHGGPMNLGSDDWLTIGARDSLDMVVAGDVSDTETITLRIKGSDLAAFRADRMSRDETRQRVEIHVF